MSNWRTAVVTSRGARRAAATVVVVLTTVVPASAASALTPAAPPGRVSGTQPPGAGRPSPHGSPAVVAIAVARTVPPGPVTPGAGITPPATVPPDDNAEIGGIAADNLPRDDRPRTGELPRTGPPVPALVAVAALLMVAGAAARVLAGPGRPGAGG